MRKKIILLFLYIIVFATGSAGLIYQVAWQKYLSRLLGSDSMATAIILATFLGGLSLGYWLCGKLTTKVRHFFKVYAILEGIIAAWALFFPSIFRTTEAFVRTWSFYFPVWMVVQGVFCSAILIGIPTICMGGTIPFLTRGISKNISEATHVHATVYAINTAGAFLGTLLAGFWLIPEFGLPLTVMGTSGLNVLAFLFFYFTPDLGGTDDMPQSVGKTIVESQESLLPPRLLYLIAFLSGFYVMTLENVFIRLVNLSLGSSSYSFSMIVSVFILAIAVGSHMVGRMEVLSKKLLYMNQLCITLLLFLLYFSLDTWSYWAHLIRIAFQSNDVGFYGYYVFVFIVLTSVLILPVGFMGATLPIAFHESKRNLANIGKHSGFLFSWNTVGSLSGSLIGGIVFFDIFDMPTIFMLTVVFSSISTCISGWRLSKRYLLMALMISGIASVFTFVTPLFDEKRFSEGTFFIRQIEKYSLKGPKAFYDHMYKNHSVLFYEDDSTATVTVNEFPDESMPHKKSRSIYVNGKSDSSTGRGDMPTLKLLAHIPALLSENRKDMLVIGLGTGVTTGELTLYPDVETIDVAEISPSVVKALPLFGEFTHQVHTNPKVRIHIADAFRVLARSRKKWDIIISEPSNPWVTGVDMLFTREFYSLAKQHLNKNGILLQWINGYSFDSSLLGMVINTLRREFDESRVFVSASGDLLIFCSAKPIGLTNVRKAVEILSHNEPVRNSLREIGMDAIENILLREIWTPSYIKDTFYDAGLQTMDNPRLHYLAGKALFMEKSVSENFVFDFHTANYSQEYLLSQLYENRKDCPFSVETFRGMLNSCKSDGNKYFPTFGWLKLRAYLCNPETYHISEKEKKDLDVALLPIITGSSASWDSLPDIKGKSPRYKIGLMTDYMTHTRSWLSPYPTDGLKKLVREAMSGSENDEEKNWFALKLAMILAEEKAEQYEVTDVLTLLGRGKNGRLAIKASDKDFSREVAVILKKTYDIELEE